jgi:Transposase DDE domain
MRIIETVARTLQSVLGAEADALGRHSGVIQRQRKFSGASLLKTLVLTVMKSPQARPDDYVATAARLGVTVTAEAIEKRFTERLLGFLRRSLKHVLAQAIAADPAAIPILEKFTAVILGDSTTLAVPDEFAAEFPGCGGKSQSGQAAVKLQATWELRTGGLHDLEIHAGRHSDAQMRAPEAPARPGSLHIYDLGYFRLKRLRRWDQQGVYWISRWQPGTAVFEETGVPLDLLAYAQQHHGNAPLDRTIVLGSAARLRCRLIVLRVSPEIAARRRQKAYEKAQKQGGVPSAAHLAACDWTIFVTNCPAALLTWQEVVVLYRMRWQIELLFKLWKSQSQLATFPEQGSAVKRMALFWAKLIGVLLQHWLLLLSNGPDPRRSHWKAVPVIRDTIVSLMTELEDLGALIRVLEKMSEAIAAVARKKRGKESPRLFQLLENPELLDWSF